MIHSAWRLDAPRWSAAAALFALFFAAAESQAQPTGEAPPSPAAQQTTTADAVPPSAAPSAAPTTAPAPAPVTAAPEAANAAPVAPPATANAATTPASDDSVDAEADAAARAAASDIVAELASKGGSDMSEPKLSIYGFADFTYIQPLGKFMGQSDIGSFSVGRLNLYTAAELGDNWRSLAEVRFMYIPNGSTSLAPPEDTTTFTSPRPMDTTVTDYTDLNRAVRWGGISIQRVWLEHTFHSALSVRIGHWLTPYGIWNVDHGSPVIIGVRRPYIIGETLFPESQTGIEAYGSVAFGPSELGYHVTLSNGRGPVDTYQDFDHNKALGARVWFRNDSKFGTLTLGASGYRGKSTAAHTTTTYEITGKAVTDTIVDARFDELSLAADLKWQFHDFLLQSEGIINDVGYPEGHRPAAYVVGAPPGFMPNYRRVGVYGLAGYRTPFLVTMPFFGGEYYDYGSHTFSPPAAAIWGGFNVRPTARVVLKAQYTHSWFAGTLPDGSSPGNYNSIDFQAAWSF